jgi:predicted nucleotidyltransferase
MKLDHVIAVVGELNKAGVRYLIVGGLAVNAHGHVRYTNDLDLVIGLEQTNIKLGLDTLAALGYLPRIPVTSEQFANASLRNDWRTEKGMVVLNLWNDRCRETPIDVFVSEPFNFAAEHLAAKLFPLADGVSAPIVALPALLQMKRDAGRPRDLDDIAELSRIEKLRHET